MQVGLEEMLRARDRRAEIQKRMLADAAAGVSGNSCTAAGAGSENVPGDPACSSASVSETIGVGAVTGSGSSDAAPDSGDRVCLVCLTMNIAGEVKRTPMVKMLFGRGIRELERLGFDVLRRLVLDEVTGCEAFWLLREDGVRVKRLLEKLEDSFPAARLFDFDVLVPGNAAPSSSPLSPQKLSRAENRRCLICDRPAAECARSRRHGLDAVTDATRKLLEEFCAEEIGNMARDSLLDELYSTPKPGLVDRNNNGAHNDMDLPMFKRSAEALRPYFRDAAMLGLHECGMTELRSRGLEAEQEMFTATGGINTHKGLIYSMGLIAAGAGKALSLRDDDPDLACAAVRYASGLARQDADACLAVSAADPSTNGARALRDYGARGAMGEASAGFPGAVYCASRLAHYRGRSTAELRQASAPVLAGGPEQGEFTAISGCSSDHTVDVNIPGALALCDIMARLEDTNLLHRGGTEGLDYVRRSASRISAMPEADRAAALLALDQELIRLNLSPGGSADMLALAFFLQRLAVK